MGNCFPSLKGDIVFFGSDGTDGEFSQKLWRRHGFFETWEPLIQKLFISSKGFSSFRIEKSVVRT